MWTREGRLVQETGSACDAPTVRRGVSFVHYSVVHEVGGEEVVRGLLNQAKVPCLPWCM